MKIAFSVYGVPIRLTQERMAHIVKGHPELDKMEAEILQVINAPDIVQQGDSGALLAVKKFGKTPVTENKYLVVAYKELSETDGFVLTAYYSSELKRRSELWKN